MAAIGAVDLGFWIFDFRFSIGSDGSLSLRTRKRVPAAGVRESSSSLSLREHCYVGIEETIKARGLSSTSDGRFLKSESVKVANDARELSLPYECSGLAILVSGVWPQTALSGVGEPDRAPSSRKGF